MYNFDNAYEFLSTNLKVIERLSNRRISFLVRGASDILPSYKRNVIALFLLSGLKKPVPDRPVTVDRTVPCLGPVQRWAGSP
jgi:hypothetical protein